MNSTKRVVIETPIGSIESDSGSHAYDVLTVAFIITLVLVGKKLLERL